MADGETSLHPLHGYIAGQIAGHIKDRHVVIIYDQNEELRPFFRELTGDPATDELKTVTVGQRTAKLCVFDGSFLKVRFAVEPATNGETPKDALIYVPGLKRDDKGSLLMELEKAGTCYRPPALKQLARIVLRRRFTDVAIDEMLKSDALAHADFARMSVDDGNREGPSLLKGIFGVADSQAILTAWIAEEDHDSEIESKRALGELRTVVRTRLGLDLPDNASLSRLRAITARFTLANEFRSGLLPAAELAGQAIDGLRTVPAPETKDQEKTIREICRRLRERYAAAYVSLADRIEGELGLSGDAVSGNALGAIDTFRFEERAVAEVCFRLIAEERFTEARSLIEAKERSFWVDHHVARKTVWEVCRLMIELGLTAAQAGATIAKANGSPAIWVERYVSQSEDGWFRVDRTQRRLETIVPEVEDEIEERALGRVRAIYEEIVRRMAEGFLRALDKSGWSVPDILHQTRIWPEIIASSPRPVAYILVDALRYEIGFELIDRIGRFDEVRLRPAIASLPSITPVGMAALLPGASASFSVVEQNGRLGAVIGGSFLPDLAARQKFAKSQIPDLVDLTLDDALSTNAKALQKKIGNAQIVLIRSTEIDAAGENTSTLYARRIMEGVVEDLARCLQRLAAAGIENVVITADHGHLFFAADRDHSMRVDAPGGDTVDLHRRCWIGRGGATPPGSLRVQGATLGYVTDLDIVVPTSTSVFKAGGDLAYHHGGASLQELVIPVITVKLKTAAGGKAEKNAVSVSHDFAAVTNRIFSIQIELGGTAKSLFDAARTIRPVVVAGDRQVAKAGVAVGATLEGGRLRLEPNIPVTVGFILTDDTVGAVRIQVLDAETDALLYASPKDIPLRLGV
jgi:hypothetical protein